MKRAVSAEFKAGVFILLGLIITLVTILLMGGGETLFQKNYALHVIMPDSTGLTKGAVVRSGGLKVGRVEQIVFTENFQSVNILMLVEEKYKPRIKADSLVKMQTQGVLGDKYLEITSGTQDKPIAENGATLEAEANKDLGSMLADSQSVVQLLKENLVNIKLITSELAGENRMHHIVSDLAEVSSNMKDISKQLKSGTAIGDLNQTMKNIRTVSDRVKNGEGTIGALFTDASLYDDMKQLIGGASRNNVLKFFVRQAVKTSDDKAVADEAKKKQQEQQK